MPSKPLLSRPSCTGSEFFFQLRGNIQLPTVQKGKRKLVCCFAYLLGTSKSGSLAVSSYATLSGQDQRRSGLLPAVPHPTLTATTRGPLHSEIFDAQQTLLPAVSVSLFQVHNRSCVLLHLRSRKAAEFPKLLYPTTITNGRLAPSGWSWKGDEKTRRDILGCSCKRFRAATFVFVASLCWALDSCFRRWMVLSTMTTSVRASWPLMVCTLVCRGFPTSHNERTLRQQGAVGEVLPVQ